MATLECIHSRSNPAEPGRWLVPLTGHRPDTPGLRPGPRPAAAFLAQLIATALTTPQTRARRREAPEHASALYAAAAMQGLANARVFHRSM